METYCMKCRKNTKNLNSKIFKTKNDKLIMQSKCEINLLTGELKSQDL